MTASEPRYAVLFRTHVWDGFVARQYERLKRRVGRGDLFILLDETNGAVATGRSGVVGHTASEVAALGLADAGEGNLLWYNGDYPLYVFFSRHPDYDYYVMVEYDVSLNVDLDAVVDRCAEANAGLLSLEKGEPVADWAHAGSCRDLYPPEEIEKRLICLAAVSRDAVRHLFERRLALSAEMRAGALRAWPFCEAFIPTELAVSGFKLMELSDFGETARYDWWPPVLEDDLPGLGHQAFVHPVLDRARYVDSTLRIWRISDLFSAKSGLRRRLSRVPVGAYAPALARMISLRLTRSLRRRFAAAS